MTLITSKTKNPTSPLENTRGFTIVEIMIAMVLALFLLTGVYQVFTTQQKAYNLEDQTTEMMQNLRVGIDFMTRDIRMAGLDPKANFPGGTRVFGFTDSAYNTDANATFVATAQEIYLTFDDNEDGVIDANEMIGYQAIDSSGDGNLDTLQIDTGTGWQDLAENIVALTFVYTYDDGELSSAVGLPDNTDGDITNDFDDIRLVRISLTARTRKEDPDFKTGFNLTGAANDGTCRTRTLTANVRPRNLGL